MATAAPPTSSMPNRPNYSCIRCANRKVKCDRQRPCSACTKRNVECVFNASQPPRKRQRRVKDQTLTDRLRLYETLLQEQGIDPSKLPDAPESEPCRRSSHAEAVVPETLQMQTPSSIETESLEPNQCIITTQVVHGQGRSKFVDK